jgi:hypothetical protein
MARITTAEMKAKKEKKKQKRKDKRLKRKLEMNQMELQEMEIQQMEIYQLNFHRALEAEADRIIAALDARDASKNASEAADKKWQEIESIWHSSLASEPTSISESRMRTLSDYQDESEECNDKVWGAPNKWETQWQYESKYESTMGILDQVLSQDWDLKDVENLVASIGGESPNSSELIEEIVKVQECPPDDGLTPFVEWGLTDEDAKAKRSSMACSQASVGVESADAKSCAAGFDCATLFEIVGE